MTLNVTSVVLFVAGVVLLYAGIKNIPPRDVITNALTGKSPSGIDKPKNNPKYTGPPDSVYTDPDYYTKPSV
jgi:hypothetical protein